MRTAVTAATLLFALAACSTTEPRQKSPFQQPNALMANEIDHRIEQIPYQHRQELLQNLMWLVKTGEQTIPSLLAGLESDNAKVRSSCCWVLGRLRDRRTVGNLQPLVKDPEVSVQFEAARSLVLMGDLEPSRHLITGLDSDRKEVRYMCHEALKTATGHDFGYDHLNDDRRELQLAVLRWRQWWGEYSGEQMFAQSYAEENGLGNLAAPAGETQPQTMPIDDAQAPLPQPSPSPSGEGSGEGTDETSGAAPEGNAGDENANATQPATQPVVLPPAVTPQPLEVPANGAGNGDATPNGSLPKTAPGGGR